MSTTKIEWCDATWNPVRGCTRVSEGCRHCYAHTFAERFRGVPGHPYEQGFDVRLVPEKLTEPLRWRKPRRVFVNSMSDLFHPDVPDEFIDRVFAVMALSPEHVFIVLTKRPERMRDYVSDSDIRYRVAKAADQIAVALAVSEMGEEEIRAISDYPGYFVSDRGTVYSSHGSGCCEHCGGPVSGKAHKRYCSLKCRQNACYRRRTGRGKLVATTMRPMSPDVGEHGHSRVMLYREGEQHRELVHRLVLSVFMRPPFKDEQGCHRDGDPTNNAVPNLRWGTQSENWEDRKRHGNARSYAKLTPGQVAEVRAACSTNSYLAGRYGVSETQVRNIRENKQWLQDGIEWPLPQVWAGVSCENQETADARIPILLQTPAAKRLVSLEPLLGSVDLASIEWPNKGGHRVDVLRGGYWCEKNWRGLGPSAALGAPRGGFTNHSDMNRVGWVIVGSESGPKARPMDEDWVRSIRDQCQAVDVPFFYKQRIVNGRKVSLPELDGRQWAEWPA